jgi:putative ABC transport system permease protein
MNAGRPLHSLPGLAGTLAMHWWPQVAALALAAAVVAATIVGAAGAGSAVERGLLQLALARLGGIETVVTAEHGASSTLVASVAAAVGPDARVVPAFVASVTVAVADGDRLPVRATLLACDEPTLLAFASGPPAIADGEAVVNQPLAALLDGGPITDVVLRIPLESDVPADSPLGRRSSDSSGRRLRVAAVLPREGLGQFSLRPAQVTEPLVVVPLATVRQMQRREQVANRLLVVPSGREAAAGARSDGQAVVAERSREFAAAIRGKLRVDLADVGLALDAVAGSGGLRLTSRRLILPPEADRAATAVLAPLGGRPSLVFLANAITAADAAGRPTTASVPYSTIAGIDATSGPLGDLVDETGGPLPLPGDDEIIIDQWTADDLAAQGHPVAAGDRLLVTLFAPETVAGRVEEKTVTLSVVGIAALRGAAVARGFVPEVAGVTDERSIADWDPPFPFERSRVRTTPPHDEDDRYWKLHGPAPKAFVSLATARRVAGSRFGMTTAWHLSDAAVPAADAVRERLAGGVEPERLGVVVEPVRAEAVAAARGSTPFGGLFLGLSSFVVGAGLLLLWLLFSLLVAARRRDIGMLAAVGWPPARVAGLLLLVGGGAAAVGVVIGSVIGPWWTRMLLAALARSWNADVVTGSTAALTLGRPAASAIWPAACAALASAVAAVVWSAWRAGHRPPRSLLAESGGTHVGGWIGSRPVRSLLQLAIRGLGHAPRRALSVAAIVALAEFLLVAVSSFTLRPPADPAARSSPTGGWTWLARFGTATALDPSDPDTRAGLGLSAAAAAALAECRIARLRSNGGDDASCTNLYAADRPTVIGVGPDFVARGGFSFVAHAARAGTATADNPWLLLDRQPDPRAAATPGRVVPAILDQATAQWALKLGGVGSRFDLVVEGERKATLEIVGLLNGSILQGFVVVAEREFVEMFPARSGYQLAVVDAGAVPPALEPVVPGAVAAAWADAAVTVESTTARLRSLQAVQNTFLTGFQLLGGLGLLLGTAGVAAVQAQGVVERLGALSLLRAVGFRVGRVRLLLVLETLVMVGLGLAVGAAAGWLAVARVAATSGGRPPLAWIAATCAGTLAVACLASLGAASRQVIPERPRAE